MIIEQLVQSNEIKCVGKRKQHLVHDEKYNMCICGELSGYKITFYTRGIVPKLQSTPHLYVTKILYDCTIITGIDNIVYVNHFNNKNYNFITYSVKYVNRNVLTYIKKSGDKIIPLKDVKIYEDPRSSKIRAQLKASLMSQKKKFSTIESKESHNSGTKRKLINIEHTKQTETRLINDKLFFKDQPLLSNSSFSDKYLPITHDMSLSPRLKISKVDEDKPSDLSKITEERCDRDHPIFLKNESSDDDDFNKIDTGDTNISQSIDIDPSMFLL
jgi:hypothetical protein